MRAFALIAFLAPAATAQVQVDDARAQRLATQKSELEEALAAMQRFGRHEEFLAAVTEVVATLERGDGERVDVPVAEGTVAEVAFHSFHAWQQPRAGGDVPLAIDVQADHHPFAGIVDADRQVRARGIDFLVIVVPTRLEVYPELVIPVPETTGFAGMGKGTLEFLLALNRAGVETLALIPHFARERYATTRDHDDELFLRTDSHWTPQGAELAAKVLAERLAGYPWFARGPCKEGEDFELADRKFMFGGGTDLSSKTSLPERVHAKALAKRGAQFEAADDASAIVVFGDSFVRCFRPQSSDFCTQICRFSGHKIDVVMAAGDGVFSTRQRLARRTPEEWAKKKLVVWLVNESTLVPGERWDPMTFVAE